MLRWIPIVMLAGCGRIAFDELGDAGGSTEPVRHIISGGAGNASIDDIALHDSGDVVILGHYTGVLELAGRTATSIATRNDMFVARLDQQLGSRWQWTGGCSDICEGQGVEFLGDRVAVGGMFQGTLTNGGGLVSGPGQDALLMQLDASGTSVDLDQFGGTSNVQIRGLDVEGNQIIAGGLYANVVDFGLGPLPTTSVDNGFVVVFDGSAMAVRNRPFSGTGDVWPNDVALAADGGACVVGRFNTTTSFGGGSVASMMSDGFVARYDAQGLLMWARVTAGTSSETAGYTAVLSNGDCVAGGQHDGAFSLDGHSAPAIGSADNTWFARFDSLTGTVRWLRVVTSTIDNVVLGLTADTRDRIFAIGQFVGDTIVIDRALTPEGASDAYMIELDPAGNLQWLRHVSGAGGISTDLAGVAANPSATRVGFSFSFDGAITIDELTKTASGVDGAIVIFPTP